MLFPGTPIYKRIVDDGLLVRNNKIVDVYSYNYQDKGVNETIAFLDSLKQSLQEYRQYAPFISLKREYERLIALVPSARKQYEDFISKYEKQEFDDINEFFKIVFVEKDLPKASYKKDAFIERIIKRAINNNSLINEMRKKAYEAWVLY